MGGSRYEADCEELGISSPRLDSLFAYVRKIALREQPCATQVAVARHGRLVGFATCGHASFAGVEAPATNDSLFSIFSVTKALVSSASWLLLQDARLRLADPVVKHLPEFGRHGKDAVTVEHLLLHTSGFPRAELDPLAFADVGRRTEIMAEWRLEWRPGSRFVYHGSSGMWVVAALIEAVTGEDFRDFVRERILDRLGLADFYLGLPESENARAADVVPIGEPVAGEQRAPAGLSAPDLDEGMWGRFNRPEIRAVGVPGGGGVATAAAVALFYQGMLSDAVGRGAGIWKPETLADAWRPRTGPLTDPMTGRPALRGLGVVVAGEGADKIFRGFPVACSSRAIGHMGAGGQVAWGDPGSGLSFAYCTSGAQRDILKQGGQCVRASTLAVECLEPE